MIQRACSAHRSLNPGKYYSTAAQESEGKKIRQAELEERLLREGKL